MGPDWKSTPEGTRRVPGLRPGKSRKLAAVINCCLVVLVSLRVRGLLKEISRPPNETMAWALFLVLFPVLLPVWLTFVENQTPRAKVMSTGQSARFGALLREHARTGLRSWSPLSHSMPRLPAPGNCSRWSKHRSSSLLSRSFYRFLSGWSRNGPLSFFPPK
jgi:hypothetical protein